MAEQLMPAPDAREFTANGHTYRVNELLTLARHREFQRLHIWLMAGSDFRQWHAQVGKAYGILGDRKGNIVDAGMILHNVLEGVKREADEGQNLYAQLCALFFNREDENPATYNEEEAAAKIKDWEEAGIPAPFFVRRAYDLVLSYLAACTPDTPSPSSPKAS